MKSPVACRVRAGLAPALAFRAKERCSPRLTARQHGTLPVPCVYERRLLVILNKRLCNGKGLRLLWEGLDNFAALSGKSANAERFIKYDLIHIDIVKL